MRKQELMQVECQCDGRLLRRSKLWSYFRRLLTKVHQINEACTGVIAVCRFPLDDILLRSGDVCNQVAKLSKIMLHFFVSGPPQDLCY